VQVPLVLNAFLALVDRVSKILVSIVMALLSVLVAAMLYEVVSRRVFDAPTLWAFDVSYMINGIIFLGAAGYTLMRNEHIRIDVFSQRLPVSVQHAINFAIYACLFLPAMAIICHSAVSDAYHAFVTGEVERVSPWAPLIWPYYSAVALGLLVLFLQSIAQTIRHAIGIRRQTPLGPADPDIEGA
jgi:TRAP-type mannitol/chloroaromatic compound transport system permease small subunit